MKYTINHTCGHTEVYDLGSDRERQIAYLESIECPECRKAKEQDGKILVSIKYGEWKETYKGYFKIAEYNAETKCMDAYMTAKEKEQFDFFHLYTGLQEKIGQTKCSYGDAKGWYDYYSKEYGITSAIDLIDHLDEMLREKGLLK